MITNPKTFKIYHGRWKSNSGSEDNNEIYPVMILGWDSQDGSGLKNTTLDATGLLNKGSFPPNCYVYESNKIVGWARGYEDGGAKVDSRKFPVMFFDEFQTVAWLPARYLTKFPLYNRTPPPEPDHPFNAARRWIAEREGFSTWEEREQARLHSPVARLPSMSPANPNGDEPTDATNKLGGRENRESLPTTTNTDSTVDKDDSESISSNSEAMSISTANTEMLIEEWREKGGEIPGDDDYSVSGSDTENTVEPAMEDWNKLFSHATEPNSSPDRPWAFYSLRSIENNEELNNTDNAMEEPGEKQPSISTATETGSALGPARWTSSYTVNSRESPESHTLEMLEASHGIQHSGQLDNRHLGDGAASASQPECVGSTLSESTLASIIDNIIATPTAGLKQSKVYIVSGDVDGDKGISSLSCGTPNKVMPKASDNVRSNPCGNTKALNSNEMSGNDSRRDDIRSGDEIRVAGEGLVENGQPTTKEIVQIIQQKEDKNNAKEHDETKLIVNEATTSSTNPPAATTAPISTQSIRNPFANATTSPDSAEFELSQCSNGEISWERSRAEEDCIKLFYDKDQKILATWRGPVDVTIELMEIVSFSRESIPGLEGNSILVLNNKDGSSWKLVFNQSKESTLPTGMIQSRRFIRRLRNANPDITCLEKV
ncbi:hypothetical protein K445DRAFT_241236 [Daldinia sp. EC12]|nr:hypothetical protein K445DRAFT_241236 [Daldinia sp. EC12]